jgi:hypothetical protein
MGVLTVKKKLNLTTAEKGSKELYNYLLVIILCRPWLFSPVTGGPAV